MTILAVQEIQVRQIDVNDPELEILTNNNTAKPEFKFKSDVVDREYGGSISRIQFYQGLPIFTTGIDSCVGFF